MRPGQNKRMRGRNNNNNNNNRKGPNPLTRSYESNGPDVKIRGTAHHVAEKYLQLARDAQSSGDPVAAESYLQHAEHYFRLIASAQQAQMGYARQPEDADGVDGDDEEANAIPDRFASPPERVPAVVNQPAPAPYGDRQPYAGDRQPFNGDRQPYNGDRQNFNGEPRQQQQQQDRQERGGYDRQQRGDRPDRQGRGPRPYRDNQDPRPDNRHENRGPDYRNQDYRNGEFREQPARLEQPAREPAPRDSFVETRQPDTLVRQPEPVAPEAPALPAFITAPVRVVAPTPEPAVAEPETNGHETLNAEPAAEETPRFPRRRRRTRPAAVVNGSDDGEPQSDSPAGNE